MFPHVTETSTPYRPPRKSDSTWIEGELYYRDSVPEEAEILQALQDEALVQQTEQRLAAGQAEARQFAVQGVPSVFAETGQGWQQVKVY